MDTLIDDIIVYITNFLNDKDKLYFLSSCEYFHLFKTKIFFNDCVYIDKIMLLSYFDRFTSVVVNDTQYKLPTSCTILVFNDDFNGDIEGYIPNGITCVVFGNSFNQNIRGCIPNSVTRIYFKDDFNQDIKECIPESV